MTEYVLGLRQDMREALRMFRMFDRKWNEMNDAFKVKFERDNQARWRAGREPLTVLAMEQVKSANVEFAGYMSTANWWRDKANALGTIILAEQAADAMLRDN